jgi:hypothetical protein
MKTMTDEEFEEMMDAPAGGSYRELLTVAHAVRSTAAGSAEHERALLALYLVTTEGGKLPSLSGSMKVVNNIIKRCWRKVGIHKALEGQS